MGEFRTIVLATAIAGTLDILSAITFGGMAGRSPSAVLTSVAAGPFGKWVSGMGPLGPLLGLLVHFSIMAVMVIAFVFTLRAWPSLSRHPVLSGLVYGFILYGVMYWVVLPARWPTVFPQRGGWDVANALFSHVVCVGLPIGLVVSSGVTAAKGDGKLGAGSLPAGLKDPHA